MLEELGLRVDQSLGVATPGRGSILGRPWAVGTTDGTNHQAGNLGLTLHGHSFQSVISNNTLVMVCVNAASPFLSFNTSLNCTTGMGRWRLAK